MDEILHRSETLVSDSTPLQMPAHVISPPRFHFVVRTDFATIHSIYQKEIHVLVLPKGHLYLRASPRIFLFIYLVSYLFVYLGGATGSPQSRTIRSGVSSNYTSAALSAKNSPMDSFGCGSKPMVPFWGRCTTDVRTYFSGWIGSRSLGANRFGFWTHGHFPWGERFPAKLVPPDSSYLLTLQLRFRRGRPGFPSQILLAPAENPNPRWQGGWLPKALGSENVREPKNGRVSLGFQWLPPKGDTFKYLSQACPSPFLHGSSQELLASICQAHLHGLSKVLSGCPSLAPKKPNRIAPTSRIAIEREGSLVSQKWETFLQRGLRLEQERQKGSPRFGRSGDWSMCVTRKWVCQGAPLPKVPFSNCYPCSRLEHVTIGKGHPLQRACLTIFAINWVAFWPAGLPSLSRSAQLN